ncbi:MAG: glycine cleavage system protein GcvH [Acholeplasmataceae bacterium]|nr:glycine cleavage system protein GcvH [Acholeplasmataceae bacterium]
MKMIKEGLLYTKSHEWLKVEGKFAFTGISYHAQESLGSIVYIELPKIGKEIKKGNAYGAVESVKAASDLYLPVSGIIVKANEALLDAPELINEDPYENWIAQIELLDEGELNGLLTSEQYQEISEE